ncbi:MAG: hypothetical protein ABI837_19925 [Acidobacteriota bacterium]
MNSLTEIRDRMAVLVGRPELLGFINARLVLRTGITLNHTNETHSRFSYVSAAAMFVRISDAGGGWANQRRGPFARF